MRSETVVPSLLPAQRRTVRTLLVGQVLGSVGVTVGFALGTLVATRLAGSAAVAGVAAGLSTLCTVVATAILTRITDAYGRRPGLGTGYLLAAAGGLLCTVAVVSSSFVVFLAGGVLFSVAAATDFQARYAAADLAERGTEARSISMVVWASTIGAVLGPNTIALGAALARGVGYPDEAGAYLIATAGFGLAGLVTFTWLRPDPLLLARAAGPRCGGTGATARPAVAGSTGDGGGTGEGGGTGDGGAKPGRHLRGGLTAIRRSWAARYAVTVTVTIHVVMIAVMSWTPLHMEHGGSGLGAIGVVLSGHLVGMFALSPVIGWIADRLGAVRTLTGSGALLLLALALAGSAGGQHSGRLGVALFGVGVAWSGAFIAGSGLLTAAIAIDARPAAQGVLDILIWTCGAGALAGGGWVVEQWGYPGLIVACAAATAPTLLIGARALTGRALTGKETT